MTQPRIYGINELKLRNIHHGFSKLGHKEGVRVVTETLDMLVSKGIIVSFKGKKSNNVNFVHETVIRISDGEEILVSFPRLSSKSHTTAMTKHPIGKFDQVLVKIANALN